MLPLSLKSRSGAGMLLRLCKHHTTSSSGMANQLIRSRRRSSLMMLLRSKLVGWSSLSLRASRKKRVLSVLVAYAPLTRLRSLPTINTFKTLYTVSRARAANCWASSCLSRIKRALAKQETKALWHLRLTRNKYRISAPLTSSRSQDRPSNKKL